MLVVEVLHQVCDLSEDRESNIDTLPLSLGLKTTKKVVISLSLTGVLTSVLLVYYINWIYLVSLGFWVYRFFRLELTGMKETKEIWKGGLFGSIEVIIYLLLLY